MFRIHIAARPDAAGKRPHPSALEPAPEARALALIRPSWHQRLTEVVCWRGADGLGIPLGRWIIVLLVGWVLALLFRPLEPALLLLPPMLALAVGIPCMQALFPSLRAAPTSVRRTWFERFEMLVVMAVFAIIGLSIFGSMWSRGMLIDSGDHQLIMGRAQIIYEGLRHGQLVHWTHLWQGGDTLTDLYPIEANLFVALVHAFAPRGTSFVVSYTAFVLWTWWLRGVGVYYLARRFSSPLIALLLAIASLFDVGSDVMGGVWHAAIYFGMVHNTLALTFGLFATALLVDLTREVTGGRFVACVLLVALSACGHALGMLVMVVSTFALGVAIVIGRGRRREALWAFGASCLGLGLGAVWLVPFGRALAESNYSVATAGATFSDLGKGFLDGTLPTSSLASYWGLAITAAAVACLAAETPVVFAGIACVLLATMTLTQFMVGSRVLDYFPALADGQPTRNLAAFKTTVIPCLAWLLQGVYRRLPPPSMSLQLGKVVRRTVLLGILGYGLGRAALGGVNRLRTDLVNQVAHSSHEKERTHTGEDYRQVFAWLKEHRRADASPIPWRVAMLWRTVWRHATWAEGLNTGVPITDPHSIPTTFFSIRPRETSARGFNDWNIRYAVTDYAGAPFPGSTERFSSGRFHIWEVDNFDARYVLAPAGVTVSDLKLQGETIRFRVDGAPPGGVELQLRTAAYPRWRARQNGAWLQVGARLPRPDSKPKQEQLLVRAYNGPVVLTCDGPLPGYWLGLFVSIAAIVSSVLGASTKRREQFEAFVLRLWQRVVRAAAALRRMSSTQKRLAVAAGLAVLAAAGVVAAVRGPSRLMPATVEGLSGLSVRWRGTAGSESAACQPAPWLGQYRCGDQAAVVDNWLGTTSPRDDSGEGPKLWPGIRVVTRTAPSTVTLDFGRLHLDAARGFWLQTAAWGGQRLKVNWNNKVLANYSLNGEQMHQLPIPRDSAGSRPMSIEIDGDSGSTLVLRGGSGPAPRFR